MTRASPGTVLSLNAGSSSLKFGLFQVLGQNVTPLMTGEAEDGGVLTAVDANGNPVANDDGVGTTPAGRVDAIATVLARLGLPAPMVVGHRIVHGGPYCRAHVRIDAGVLRRLQAAVMFAPLHLPASLALVDAAMARWPRCPQVACLDTAFHRDMPDVARTLPVPRELRERGIERYGFHGLSCESIVRQLGPQRPERLLVAHLGHGASVTAIRDGRSVDTSMGLTPSGGVVMGTRCGDIDPGVLVHVARELHYDASRLERLVDVDGGMRGVSGLSGDMRTLRAAAATNADAQLAIALFCYSVRKQLGAMTAVLGGVDLLVFTGGIGEHDARSRAEISTDLPGITAQAVRVLPPREDEQIAIHARRLAQVHAPEAANPPFTFRHGSVLS